MESLSFFGPPPQDLRNPPLVAAFGGWPDAQEAATRAVRYLVRKLSAVRFAAIDPEEFYDFTQVRPVVHFNDEGERVVRWPSNEFFYHRAEPPGRDMVLFVGTEPNLRWRSFTSLLLDVAQRCSVNMVVALGALLDAVPHTREPRVTGSANQPQLRRVLEGLGVRGSSYQGPTGIVTALMEQCRQRGYAFCSVWGHAPHYLQVSPNPRVSRAVLSRLCALLNIPLDLSDLEARERTFDAEVSQAIGSNTEVLSYIQRMEAYYDANYATPEELPDPKAVVQELEEFLRRQSRPPQAGESGASDAGR